MPSLRSIIIREGDEPLCFQRNRKKFVVRTHLHGEAITVMECEVDGERRYFKVPLSDPFDISKSFEEASLFVLKLEHNVGDARKVFAEGVTP